MRITIVAIRNATIINARMKEAAITAGKVIPAVATDPPMTIVNGLTIGEIMKDEITNGEIMMSEIAMIGGATKTIATPHQTEEVFRITHITKI